jgi:putative ABC transport system substrate-binding protein
MNVEVIATHSTAATKAPQRATSTIPIVTASTGDPVYEGLAASLAHPGGNITGFSMMNLDLTPKHIELLKTMVPELSSGHDLRPCRRGSSNKYLRIDLHTHYIATA